MREVATRQAGGLLCEEIQRNREPQDARPDQLRADPEGAGDGEEHGVKVGLHQPVVLHQGARERVHVRPNVVFPVAASTEGTA